MKLELHIHHLIHIDSGQPTHIFTIKEQKSNSTLFQFLHQNLLNPNSQQLLEITQTTKQLEPIIPELVKLIKKIHMEKLKFQYFNPNPHFYKVEIDWQTQIEPLITNKKMSI